MKSYEEAFTEEFPEIEIIEGEIVDHIGSAVSADFGGWIPATPEPDILGAGLGVPELQNAPIYEALLAETGISLGKDRTAEQIASCRAAVELEYRALEADDWYHYAESLSHLQIPALSE